MKGEGGYLAQPGQARGFIRWSKTLLQLAQGVQLIEVVLTGPDERVMRDSGHTTFLVSPLFPTAFSVPPNTAEYTIEEANRQGVRNDPDLLERLSKTIRPCTKIICCASIIGLYFNFTG